MSVKKYELLAIMPATSSPETRPKFESIVEKFGGKVSSVNELGKRALGCEVKKQKEGAVTSLEFELESLKVEPLRNALRLTGDVLRFMITAHDNVPKQPVLRERRKPPVGAKPSRPPAKPVGVKR
jgi:small subunit ribosomal protein S6